MSVVGAVALGSCSFFDGNFKAPTVEQSSFIKGPSGESLAAKAAAAIRGGGFIFAGASSTGGWAAKVDDRGHLSWFYNRPIAPVEKWAAGDPRPLKVTPSIQYTGVAEMSDGTTYVCGSVSHKVDETQYALLTHLSADGKVLGEFEFPKVTAGAGSVYSVANCAAAGNQVIVFAGALERLKPSFLFFGITESGKLVWQKSLAPMPADARSSEDSLTSRTDNHLALNPWASTMDLELNAGTQSIVVLTNDGINSELDSINQQGVVLGRRALRGRSYMLHNVGLSQGAYVYKPGPASLHKSVIERFDARLFVNNRTSVDDSPIDIFKYILDGFVQADGSFVFLGGLENGLGLQVPAGLSRVSQDFRHEKHIKLEIRGSALGLPTEFALPTAVHGQYIVAVPVARPEGWIHAPGNRNGVTPGLALYFVNAS